LKYEPHSLAFNLKFLKRVKYKIHQNHFYLLEKEIVMAIKANKKIPIESKNLFFINIFFPRSIKIQKMLSKTIHIKNFTQASNVIQCNG